MSSSEIIIEARGLAKTIDSGARRVEILTGINLTVPRGQFVTVMGPSGSGKSTLLALLAGLEAPSAGQILLDNQDITQLDEDEMAVLRGRKIGFVFQSYQLVSTLTAEENVLLPLDIGVGALGGVARARELLDGVGLSGRLNHYPMQLSGGEQQRVAIARAFVCRPPLILADEPTGNLDSVNGLHILDMLLNLNSRERTTLLLVTHNHELAGRADRLVKLHDGQIVSDELLGQTRASQR